MSNEIMISVCCLAYNHERYIRKTLDGFVNQKTDFRFEVLIHDDASTDKTPDIIREYEKKYPDIIKPIYQSENKYSQNIQVSYKYQYPRASGKYICWCEGDDYWCDSNKLQLQFDIMEKHPECSMSMHLVECINEDGSENSRHIPEDYYGIKEGIVPEKTLCEAFWLRGGYPFHTSSFCARKTVIDKILSSADDVFSYFNGDRNIIMAGFELGSFYYINRAMSKRRLFSVGNWNSRFSKLSIDKKIENWKKHVYGEMRYNEYSNFKYDEYIKASVACNILSWCMFDIAAAKDLLSECGIDSGVVKRLPIKKFKVYYMILKHCPIAFKALAALKLSGEKRHMKNR